MFIRARSAESAVLMGGRVGGRERKRETEKDGREREREREKDRKKEKPEKPLIRSPITRNVSPFSPF